MQGVRCKGKAESIVGYRVQDIRFKGRAKGEWRKAKSQREKVKKLKQLNKLNKPNEPNKPQQTTHKIQRYLT